MRRLTKAVARSALLGLAALLALALADVARPLDAQLVLVRGNGYWLAQQAGAVTAFGDAINHGSAATGADAVVDISPTPTGQGYWVATRGGTVRAFGDAAHYGDLPPSRGDLVAVVPTKTGLGYWLVSHKGLVKPAGDAPVLANFAKTSGVFVDAAGAPDGLGLVGVTNRAETRRVGTGQVFATTMNPRRDTVGMAVTPSGRGYVLAAATGDVMVFGDAVHLGSLSGVAGALIVDIAGTWDGSGYWLARADGSVHPFGGAAHYGDLAGNVGSSPLAAMASTPFVNRPPDAVDDTATTNEDTEVLIDVGVNDTDPDGDPLTFRKTVSPTNGSAALVSGSTFRYKPKVNFHGSDSFTYEAADPYGGRDTAVVRITILPVNDLPVARADTATTDEDSAVDIDVLANDTDVDGDTLTATYLHGGPHGSVTPGPGGTLRYTPDLNYNGLDRFKYRVSDGNGGSRIGIVDVTITPVNDPPVAVDDVAATDEDMFVDIDLATGDSDVDGDALAFTAGAPITLGTVTPLGGSIVRYTPDADVSGFGSFPYTVDDGHGASDTAIVTVEIRPVNDAPVAADDIALTDEDTAVDVDVLANDSDIDGGPLTASVLAPPLHGAVVPGPGGTLRYTPSAQYNGHDEFTYTADDGAGGAANATVRIDVMPVNDPPVAADDAAAVDEDGFVDIDLSTGDTDVDGDALSFAIAAQGTLGNAVMVGPTTARYTPSPNANGVDYFTYDVTDGNGGADAGTVAVTIREVNDAPVAAADAALTTEDTFVDIDVLANDTDVDGDTLTIVGVIAVDVGSVSSGDGGTLRYHPPAEFSGEAHFTYEIRDPSDARSTAEVTITVTAVNDPPAAADDTASTNEDAPVDVDVLANDTDPDGGILSVTNVGAASHGSTSIVANQVRYTPAANYVGPDSFTYTVSDPSGLTDTALVAVTVVGVNDPPTANGDAFSATAGVQLTVPAPGVLGNDTDVDNASLTAQLVTGVSHGTLSLASNGAFTYTPTAGYSGADSFTYRASDGTATSSTATVTFTVAAGGGGGGGSGFTFRSRPLEITDLDTVAVPGVPAGLYTYGEVERGVYTPYVGVSGIERLPGGLVIQVVEYD